MRYAVELSNGKRLAIVEANDALQIASMTNNNESGEWAILSWICEIDPNGIRAYEKSNIGCQDISIGLRGDQNEKN